MDAIPKDLPMWPDEMADFEARQVRFNALKDRRRVVLATGEDVAFFPLPLAAESS